MVVALGPGVGALLVALGPGLAGGETSLAAGVHSIPRTAGRVAHPVPADPRRHGGHTCTPSAAPAHADALGVALVVAAALVFTSGAVGYLRGRSAPGEPDGAGRLDAGPA